MSTSDKQAVKAVHQLLMERFPKAFPKNYDQLIPLKTGIYTDLVERLPEVNATLLRRALANHTSRHGYLLALIHHKGDRRYSLDGLAVGTVTPEERAHAMQHLAAATERGQVKAQNIRTHQEREEKRRRQREIERKNREAKAARRAAEQRRQQEHAARRAALEAQGITVESRSERKQRLIREAAARADARSRSKPTEQRPSAAQSPATPAPATAPTPPALCQADRSPLALRPKTKTPTVEVTFKKRRRIVPPTDENLS